MDRTFFIFKKKIKQIQPNLIVKIAFLELIDPNLITCVAQLYKKNINTITIVPIFIGKGNHIERDLQNLLKNIKKIYPNINIRTTLPIGESKKILTEIAKYCIRSL
ncbi:CbiX/SirB N-terminal domain-containing protein [Candidatus Profftella armatura]